MSGSCRLLALAVVVIAPRLLSAQSETMSRVSVDGRAVAYHMVGSGRTTPLLLLNGGPGLDHGYLHMSDVWRRFGRSRPVVFLDQLGTGQSDPVGAQDSVTIGQLLDGIEAIRTALGAERVHVLGHSWGGYLALAYALRHPDRVARLVLVGSPAPNLADTEFLFGAIFPDSLERGAPAALARLTTPTLVTTGRYDANVAPRTAWRIHRAMPSSTFAVFEQSGHYPMIEEPEVFLEVVERFLRTP